MENLGTLKVFLIVSVYDLGESIRVQFQKCFLKEWVGVRLVAGEVISMQDDVISFTYAMYVRGVRIWDYKEDTQNICLNQKKEKGGYGECENVYIFRAKYCCEDVSLFT